MALRIFLAGVCDLKTVSLNSTLAELGMDSMTAVEIKETLERDFEVYLTSQEIRNLTFASINELSAAHQRTDISRQHLEDTHTILFEGGELFVLEGKGIVVTLHSFLLHHGEAREYKYTFTVT
jgi:fatty acid synthase